MRRVAAGHLIANAAAHGAWIFHLATPAIFSRQVFELLADLAEFAHQRLISSMMRDGKKRTASALLLSDFLKAVHLFLPMRNAAGHCAGSATCSSRFVGGASLQSQLVEPALVRNQVKPAVAMKPTY